MFRSLGTHPLGIGTSGAFGFLRAIPIDGSLMVTDGSGAFGAGVGGHLVPGVGAFGAGGHVVP